MGRDDDDDDLPPSDIESKLVQPRRVGGDNSVHPVSGGATSEESSPTPLQQQPQRSHLQPLTTVTTSSTQEFRPFKKWVSWLIPLFVIVNVVMFLVTMSINNCPKNSSSCLAGFLGRFSFQPFKENPLLGPTSNTLMKMGALDVNKMVKEHQWWRLFSCIWLHAGVFHILANMASLLFIGIRLEHEFGFVRIGVLYVISGIGGNLLSALFLQTSISVGASGALFGLLGAMLSELLTNWTIYANKFAALITLVLIIVINLGVGILPHVDNFAHLGGFASGFLLGFVFLIRPQFGWVSQRSLPPGYPTNSAKPKYKTYQYVLWVSSLILLIVGFTVGLVMLFRGVDGNNHCSWCRYLSCVPTSKWSCKAKSTYCTTTQYENEVSLVCGNNGRTKTYKFGNATDAQIRQLCTQLCA